MRSRRRLKSSIQARPKPFPGAIVTRRRRRVRLARAGIRRGRRRRDFPASVTRDSPACPEGHPDQPGLRLPQREARVRLLSSAATGQPAELSSLVDLEGLEAPSFLEDLLWVGAQQGSQTVLRASGPLPATMWELKLATRFSIRQAAIIKCRLPPRRRSRLTFKVR